jgi:hypothetical protein
VDKSKELKNDGEFISEAIKIAESGNWYPQSVVDEILNQG